MSVSKRLKQALRPVTRRLDYWKLPDSAKVEDAADLRGLTREDSGVDAVVREGIDWLCRAQESSPDRDGGVARHFSLVSGWGHSYPETTGYIVPTLLDWSERTGEARTRDCARRMLDWFIEIQFADGGFQGGMINASPRVPVTFNTGQILLGLAAGATAFGEPYREPMRKAADWLRDSMDPDGAWRKHPTPFAAAGEKAYETHVAWGLLEAARVMPDQGYAEAAKKNIEWALTKQRSNGWIDDCCLNDPARPLTHTIGYAVRGILEGWRYSDDPNLLDAACLTLDAIAALVDEQGKLVGRLDANWQPCVPWVCLTGSSQLAHCYLMTYPVTGDERHLKTGLALNRYVRRTVKTDGPDEIRGAVKGSFPVSGAYGRFEYLNWAVKFTVDANLLERDLDASAQ